MGKTPFSKKCEILGTIWMLYKDDHREDAGWAALFDYADVGFPMAYMSWQNMVTIKKDQNKYVLETWTDMCNMLQVDPLAKYDTVAELFDASPFAEDED